MKAKRIEPAEVKAKRGRPKVARPMKRVNISVNPNDYEAIERLAAANGMSAAMLVRLAMKEFCVASAARACWSRWRRHDENKRNLAIFCADGGATVTAATKAKYNSKLASNVPWVLQLDQSKVNIDVRSRTSRLPWRGQFSPEFIEYIIRAVCPDSRSFLDPFCGSGTVLFEALQNGHSAVGFEVNPAAWHLASLSSFAALPSSDKREIIDQVRNVSATYSSSGLSLFANDVTPLQLVERLSRKDIHPFLARTLAAVILLGMGNNRELTTACITRGSLAVLTILNELASLTARADCCLVDARRPPLAPESIEAVITSPPYINVFNYHQNYRPAAEVLGWNPLEAARAEVGANRKHRQNRFMTVIQYCLDMAQCLEATATSMKIGAPLIMVIGRTSNVLGASFLNGELVKRLIDASEAFGPLQCAERVFTSRFGERIYEDILVTSREASPRVNYAEVREVGKDALRRALSCVPDQNRQALEEAIESAADIAPSPYLAISTPPAFIPATPSEKKLNGYQ